MTTGLRLLYIATILLLVQRVPIEAQIFVQPRPLAKGIADVQAQIAKETELANGLRDAVSEHAINFGKILYGAYGQEGDPAKELIKLREAYESVHSAVENGVTGQVWPAVGQLGQALLDYGSELNPTVNNINAFQQMGWEAGRLKITLSELNGYTAQITRDTEILQSLESKSADIAARRSPDNTNVTSLPPTADSILPVIPAKVDLSALDDALLMDRWLDVGNRAFKDQSEEDHFYSRFPAFKKFQKVAETQSPRADVERGTVSKKSDFQACSACLDKCYSATLIPSVSCMRGCPCD